MLEFSPDARLLAELHNFNSIVSWYGANRPEFRAAVQGLPFEFLRAIPPDDCGMHAADFFAAQVGLPGPAVPHIDCPRHDGGFAVIHPFSGSAKKCWPLERYRELARRLDMPVRWCAGPEETLADAVRIDDLYELAGWLATARVYIGNDSGITHLAAAVGNARRRPFRPDRSAHLGAARPERLRNCQAGDRGHRGGGSCHRSSAV